MSNSLQNTLVYLIGFPGTGKYTIAKEIARQADFKLVDNHLINNPMFSIIKADGVTKLPDRIWDNVDKVWSAVLDTMAHISPPEFSFVLTNALYDDDPEDLVHFNNIKAVAEKRQGHFIPVLLTISDLEEHRKRITTEERRHRFKEINPDAPEKYATKRTLLTFEHPNKLALDVSGLSAQEATTAILEHTTQVACKE